MIKVSIHPEAQELFSLSGFTEEQIETTINDRHKGMVAVGNPLRIVAVHWFGKTIAFVSSTVTRQTQEGERTRFDEVEATIILKLERNLPTGKIEPNMEMLDIQKIIASSFGVLVKCSENGQRRYYQTDTTWDGNSLVFTPDKDDTVFIQGAFDPQKKRCTNLWAFSNKRYKTWLRSRMT